MKRVLVIEQDEDICEIYKLLFRQSDIKIKTSTKGIKECIREFGPDLIIADDWTCDCPPSEALKLLKNAAPDPSVPLIFCSTNVNANDAVASFNATFLEKPFDLCEIETLVRDLIDIDIRYV